METFTNKLKSLRKEKGVTQKQVAQGLEMKEEQYRIYENGRSLPGFENLIKLANYFNVSLDYLVGRTDVKEINQKQ